MAQASKKSGNAMAESNRVIKKKGKGIGGTFGDDY